ncbi:MAG: NAD(P)-dependent oxidoreductase [Arthrospira platensis PCC 7345]|uniref:NAD-dependent epimerase/dehydratase family protein n=1 Tax=Limnospira platensis TaxID=118562 RepID=UPI0028E136BF|nr:NAD(P)-dependent oxidoreductase [Arthrospira platensis PCC 7345]
MSDLVLVTGALGWLGFSLVKALVKGLPDIEAFSQPRNNLMIRCLILPGQNPESLTNLSDKIEVIVGDLRNPQDCDRFCENANHAILFHTAGIIHPPRVSEFYHINVNGTQNLLNSAVTNRVKRAVIVSSNSPCGCNPHPDHLFDEKSPYHPYMNYGKSKMLMELAVMSMQQSGRIETVIVRPPWFYGPNQPPRQTLFFQMIRDGKGPIVGDGNNLRSMAYIDNLCQGLLLSAESEKANGQTYWIADNRPYSMNEIIDTVEKLLESEFNQTCAHKRLKLPGITGDIATLVDGTLQSLGLYQQKIHVLSEMNKTIACSVAKAQRELGYSPKVSLEEGMRRSLKWVFDNYGGIDN